MGNDAGRDRSGMTKLPKLMTLEDAVKRIAFCAADRCNRTFLKRGRVHLYCCRQCRRAQKHRRQWDRYLDRRDERQDATKNETKDPQAQTDGKGLRAGVSPT